MTIELRAMQPADLEQGYRLSQQVSWPHRREDWQQALAHGAGLVAENEQQIVGCAILWPWGDTRSTLGLVIVDPACQGKGIGKKLIDALLAKVPNGNVRLHATEMGQGLYEKYGFIAQGAIFQHQIAQLPECEVLELAEDETIRPLREDELPTLIDKDNQSHGLYRPTLWKDLFVSAESLLVLDKAGEIQGYMTLRKFGRGNVIGPLLAKDEQCARKLFCYAAALLQGQFVRMDTYGHTPFSDWLVTQGLPVIDAPVMMVRGLPWQRSPEAMIDFSFMSQAMG
ncbi:GNAT family N-acetyltransferase [Rosenbergiella australiborealis]|uniref:GNAT family N-acetyltransferase n=1 Tax=Rosenbergiella australiborealis TaxID=1544696 RepID=A0ABS5T2W1_9GAMM|nr:GNAT family N-acetyltransferase [Rosenbergiella australiborealis]MBT0726684.1 GNAT family N-acetyltransferase [Rosenbergiella australiborealis]